MSQEKREEKAPKKKATRARKTEREKELEKHYLQIQEAAYFLAENDGFEKEPVEYWLEAEASLEL